MFTIVAGIRCLFPLGSKVLDHDCHKNKFLKQKRCPAEGLLQELNPGPLAPETRIIPLDHPDDDSIGVINGDMSNPRPG